MAGSAAERVWVGFDLGGTKMLAAVLDADLRLVGRSRRKTKAALGPKAGLERIMTTIREALADASVRPEQIAGIGVGCPGQIDLDEGVVIESANLGWRDFPIRAALEEAFGCPAVVLNDVDAGLYGEYRFGAGKGDAACWACSPAPGSAGRACTKGSF